jgi:hypothetical protein
MKGLRSLEYSASHKQNLRSEEKSRNEEEIIGVGLKYNLPNYEEEEIADQEHRDNVKDQKYQK